LRKGWRFTPFGVPFEVGVAYESGVGIFFGGAEEPREASKGFAAIRPKYPNVMVREAHMRNIYRRVAWHVAGDAAAFGVGGVLAAGGVTALAPLVVGGHRGSRVGVVAREAGGFPHLEALGEFEPLYMGGDPESP
jgi:hypothetical protein